MQLSSRCNDCWSSHILSAMNGLTQSYIMLFKHVMMFKERLLKFEPIDLGRFLWTSGRHLDYWVPCSDAHPQDCNSKRSTYHHWCALPRMRALVTHLPYIITFPDSCFLTFLVTLSAVWHASILVPIRAYTHTYTFICTYTRQVETVTWTHSTSPTSCS